MRKLLVISLLAFLLGSCEKEKENLIHPAFQIYVDRFYNEAEKRGVTLSDLEIVFSDLVPADFCGYAYNSTHPPLVRIRNTELCWMDRTDMEKENLIFHELGHALLKRPHIVKSFNGGYTSSIMCASQGTAYCNNFQVYYNNEMRTYFLDELFNTDTSPPDWTINEQKISTLFSDSISSIDDWEFFSTDEAEGDYSFYLDEGNFNNSKSLAIEKSAETTNESYGFYVNRFDIESFPACSSIKAKALVKSLNRFNGYVGIAISLRETALNGELRRFALHEFRETNSHQFINGELIETELFCIPEKTEVVSISVSLKSSSLTTILIDDITVELWD